MRRLFILVCCTHLAAFAEVPPIQQWIDEAIAAGGGVVTIPEGEHVLHTGLVIKDAKKLALRGMNKETCILKLETGTNEPNQDWLIKVTGNGDTLEIANLTLDGGSDTQSRPSELIVIEATDDPTSAPIKDVNVRDCLLQNYASAISVKNAIGCVIERCSFRDGGQRAISFLMHSKDCQARGNQITRTTTAIYLYDAQSCLIEGNEMWECAQGIHIGQEQTTEKLAPHTLRNNGFFDTKQPLFISENSPAPLNEKSQE
ncbi:MAG: right-handed parallel beta-helix repeat-containing protein [Prosthecobacter sp.]|nr:right-handed parallel beta-helix repeat-containing protein [Prosthecobacter sp.]